MFHQFRRSGYYLVLAVPFLFLHTSFTFMTSFHLLHTCFVICLSLWSDHLTKFLVVHHLYVFRFSLSDHSMLRFYAVFVSSCSEVKC